LDAATFARSVSFAKSPFKGCAKGVSFRLFFCDDFFGAFFLHLILILIDPDFNEQQQKTTEEKTL